jgi:hypothetical protein
MHPHLRKAIDLSSEGAIDYFLLSLLLRYSVTAHKLYRILPLPEKLNFVCVSSISCHLYSCCVLLRWSALLYTTADR